MQSFAESETTCWPYKSPFIVTMTAKVNGLFELRILNYGPDIVHEPTITNVVKACKSEVIY
jgi:hypothetical protein